MNKGVRIILHGFFLWLIPFLVAVLLWDTSTNQPRVSTAWFGAIMAFTWTLTFAIVASFYFKGLNRDFAKQGLITGISWYLMSVILELVVLVGLFKTSLSDYSPALLSYLNTLVMTIMIGYLLNKKLIKEKLGGDRNE